MQLPPPSQATNGNSNGSTSQDSNGEETEREMGELDTGIATKLLLGDGDNESLASVCFATASSDPAAAKDLEDAITAYLRRATENFDLSKNVEVSNNDNLQIDNVGTNIICIIKRDILNPATFSIIVRRIRLYNIYDYDKRRH